MDATADHTLGPAAAVAHDLADPFELSDTYALVELGPRELLERLEDVMLVQ